VVVEVQALLLVQLILVDQEVVHIEVQHLVLGIHPQYHHLKVILVHQEMMVVEVMVVEVVEHLLLEQQVVAEQVEQVEQVLVHLLTQVQQLEHLVQVHH
jgi:hypothetical protein